MKRMALLVAGLLLSPASLAVEGMWTLDNLPKADLKKRYGFEPDAAWVDKVMKASVRLAGGCSGSFVSKDGLVLTNHHCAVGCIQQLSSAKKDYVANGFLAKTRADELACPQMEINRLEQISDVTARMNQATQGAGGGAEYAKRQKAEKSRIEAECVGSAADTTRCDVVELYHGGAYNLYRYRRFQDVRLAFAPEHAIAFFGGDPDNFNFPRFDLDMALVRAYESGQPVEVRDFFPISERGAAEGEPTFVTGHPGSTERQLTVAQLERVRDVDLVASLTRLSEMRGLLYRYGAESAESARVSSDDLQGVENTYKVIYGELRALVDPTVIQRKRDEERALREFARGRKPLKEHVRAWDEIAAAQAVYRDIEQRYKVLEVARGFWSKHFATARWLVRGAQERAKPNAERLREYTESALPSLTQRLFSKAPIYPDYEKVKLGWSLTKMRELLGVDDPLVKAILGREAPETVAARLVDGTHLTDIAVRKQLWEGGAEAVAKSKDPFIALARAVDAEARAVRKRYEDEVEAIENANAERLAKVRFAMTGAGAYPDATFTLRLSHGIVKGWTEKGRPVEPFTTIGGAFERHTGAAPFALPTSWLDSRARLNSAQRFNFVTTNDITGGNSGSPLLNTSAQIVGLAFDGNIHSLGGAFWFDERVNRTVAVHSGAIIEALRKVYGAEVLAKELSGS